MSNLRSLFILAVAFLLTSQSTFACTVCMGADSKVGEQVNAAIFLLLGVLFVVGSFFFGFLLYLVRCERRPIPPHQDIANLIDQGSLQ